MSSSLFPAIARMSRFCSFVSFLIGSPFVRFGSASRDETNDFFVVFFIKGLRSSWQSDGIAWGFVLHDEFLERADRQNGRDVRIRQQRQHRIDNGFQRHNKLRLGLRESAD